MIEEHKFVTGLLTWTKWADLGRNLLSTLSPYQDGRAL